MHRGRLEKDTQGRNCAGQIRVFFKSAGQLWCLSSYTWSASITLCVHMRRRHFQHIGLIRRKKYYTAGRAELNCEIHICC
jgi:hypothetical protein